MASVNRVYSALKDLVNKDQRGFVTPAVFNSFASVAQMNIFNKLFEDLDLNSTKLGRTAEARNELISKVLLHLDKIDFGLDEVEADVLGDAYEYLIAQFASGAGKKAGEFYTPQQVSKILAKLVTS